MGLIPPSVGLEHRTSWFEVGSANQDASRKYSCIVITHYETRLFKYIENFTINNWKFSDKNSDTFHISAQNIYCEYSLELPRRGGSNEYPRSQFLNRNKKNNVYPCKPQFYYTKVGFKGGQNYIGKFSWWLDRLCEDFFSAQCPVCVFRKGNFATVWIKQKWYSI